MTAGNTAQVSKLGMDGELKNRKTTTLLKIKEKPLSRLSNKLNLI